MSESSNSIVTEKTIAPIPANDLPLKMVEEKALSMKEFFLMIDKSNRDLFEEKLARVDERHRLITSYETKIRDLKFEARDTARDLQAAVYEARLQNLNHENTRLSKFQETSIPREVHDRDIATLEAKLDLATEWITRFEGSVQGKGLVRTSSTEWVKWVLGIAITVLLAYIAYIRK